MIDVERLRAISEHPGEWTYADQTWLCDALPTLLRVYEAAQVPMARVWDYEPHWVCRLCCEENDRDVLTRHTQTCPLRGDTDDAD